MTSAAPIVYRSDPEVEGLPSVMKFRLFYEGPLRSANGDPSPGRPDSKANHKHMIRREFHRQLKDVWEQKRFLRECDSRGEIMGLELGPLRPLREVVCEAMGELGGFRFVPLVCERFGLSCKLDILMLRRDAPGGIFQSRDIDNRLKVIFDALKKPRDLGELGGNTPQEGENPLYVLLQADELITHVSVETDYLLAPPIDRPDVDDSFVRLLIGVDIKPADAGLFALSFAGD